MGRAFELMELARFRPIDFSEGLASWFINTVPGQLPGAWGGAPPPITRAGRLERFDDYLAANVWRSLESGMAMLDIGCGFPPVTTIDTANRFPDVGILGIDTAFGAYLVYDANGDYACIGTDGTPRFFNAAQSDAATKRRIWGDLQATAARFATLLDTLLPELPPGIGPAEATRDGRRIIRDPIGSYEREGLRFREVGIGAAGLGPFDAVRATNIMLYFAPPFRASARRWVGGVVREGGVYVEGVNSSPFGTHRYSAWQRVGDRLLPREFAASADNFRPVGGTPWYTMQPGEDEATLKSQVICALWDSDAAFRVAFDGASDRVLDELGMPRLADGRRGTVPESFSADQRRAFFVDYDRALIEGGWVDRAAEVLTPATGKRAWRNSVGHLAVDPLEWGWKPVELEEGS